LSPSPTDGQTTREYRVVQWATGTIGVRGLRAIIEHPHTTPAGVYVHGQDKAGRDAGELCGASVHSTGSSPGFITEAAPPGPSSRADYLCSSFGPSLRLVADAIGLPLDSVKASGELAMASRETKIAAGALSAGSVAAQRITVSGIRAGRPLIEFPGHVVLHHRPGSRMEVRETYWHVSVDGDAPLEVTLRMPTRWTAWPRCHRPTPPTGRSTRCHMSAPLPGHSLDVGPSSGRHGAWPESTFF
jgi:hypothetical protein